MPKGFIPAPYTIQCPGDGESTAQIAVIGETPGATEVRLKKPFVGPSGDIFWTLMTKYAWLDQESCYVDNFCQRRLDDDAKVKLESSEFTFWRDSLVSRLESLQPRLVLAVGALASKALLGDKFNLHVGHGLAHSINGTVVFPVYHPAGALRGDSNSLSLTAYDLAQAGKWWRGEREEGDSDSAETRISNLNRPGFIYDNSPIAIDTEYYPDTGEPICWSYTFVTGEACVIWARDKESIAYFGENLKRLKPLVVFHNALADLPPLKKLGIDIDGWGIPWRDTMEQAYLLRHEPQGLKDLAERHLSLKMEDYGTVVGRTYDSRALECAREFVESHTSVSPLQTHSTKTGKPFKRPKGGKITRDVHTKKVASALKKRDVPKITELLALEGPSLAIVSKEEVEAYSARDPDATLRIYSRFSGRIHDQGLEEVERLDNAVVPMFARMSEVGLLFDEEAYGDLKSFVDEELRSNLESCRLLAGAEDFNPGSSDQVALWCRSEYKRSGTCKLYRKTTTGDDSTDRKALSGLIGEHPLIQAIIEYRTLSKLKSSYVDKLPSTLRRDGRYAPDWRLKGVETGRAAEWILTFPSRTELGRRVRSCFIAPPGYEMASFDLSQIEYRLTAALSGDPAMMEAYTSGRDLHHATVERVFGGNPEMRAPAKTVNFLMLYGGGAKNLFEGLIQAGVVNEDRTPRFSLAACGEMIDGWFKAYPGVRSLIDKTADFIRSTGYSRTELGRRRYLPAIYLEGDRLDYLHEEAIRQGFNHVIQGTAQEVIKRAMRRVWSATRDNGRLSVLQIDPLLQYHDELVFQGPEGRFEEAKGIITSAMCADSERFGIPIESKMCVGARWGELKG